MRILGKLYAFCVVKFLWLLGRALLSLIEFAFLALR